MLKDTILNIIHSKQKPMKTEGGVRYPVGDFAYTPDKDKPSTWKLRMSESRPGNVTKAQLGRAAAAFSPGGFRGQKVQIPSGDVSSVKSRLRAAYKKLGVEPADMPASIKERALMVYKSGDSYRWAAMYSNNYRDRDNPPEILSKAAHEDFAQAVNANEWPMPELRWWHVKGHKLGQADLVFFDSDNGCAWATGTFVNKEIGEALSKEIANLHVSHGMPQKEIRRDDPTDATVITRYRSEEISLLPTKAAANLLTGVYVNE